MKQLVDYGYITIVQTRGEHQTFCRNVYEVNLNPQRVLELRAEEAKKIIAAGDVQLKRAIEEMNKKLKTVKK